MKLIDGWKQYFGEKDEREYAEMNRIYKTGFLMLIGGLCVYLYYSLTLAQVRSVVTDEMVIDGSTLFMLALLLITCLVCTVMQVRKGIVDEHVRFSDAEVFPSGYFGLVSSLTGVAVVILFMLCRSVAEAQVLGMNQVHWLVNLAMGVGTGIFTSFLAYLVFYCIFRAAKSRQKKMADRQR